MSRKLLAFILFGVALGTSMPSAQAGIVGFRTLIGHVANFDPDSLELQEGNGRIWRIPRTLLRKLDYATGMYLRIRVREREIREVHRLATPKHITHVDFAK